MPQWPAAPLPSEAQLLLRVQPQPRRNIPHHLRPVFGLRQLALNAQLLIASQLMCLFFWIRRMILIGLISGFYGKLMLMMPGALRRSPSHGRGLPMRCVTAVWEAELVAACWMQG